jgi:hypothetical protein
MKAIYLIANGDLRIDANQQCEGAQAAMEKQLVAAIEKEGASVRRAHAFDPEKKNMASSTARNMGWRSSRKSRPMRR